MTKNIVGYCVFTTAIGCIFFAASVQAGTLDPRLAALTAGNPSMARALAGPRTQPLDAFSPRLDAAGRVQVYVLPLSRFTALPSAAEIAALGGVKIIVSNPLRTVQAWVPVSVLKSLAALPDVGRVTVPAYARIPRPIGLEKTVALQYQNGALGVPRAVPTGLAIDADAVQAMQANLLQRVNAQGSGIKVGVISDDNSGYVDSELAGYLPAGVFCSSGTGLNCDTVPLSGDTAEGTAMLEEVHAMAPNATLGFCGPSTNVDFVTCYQDFVTWGANVIADDLWFPGSDAFTTGTTADGSFAAAIAQITQANPKMAFTSSAGNDAQDYFQAAYTATASSCTIGGTTYTSCMDFGKALGGSSTSAISATLNSTSTPYQLILQWNDPLGSTADQLVLYLVNSSGTILATGSPLSVNDGRASQILAYTAATAGETDNVMVACNACSNPITIKIMGDGDGAVPFGTPTPGSIGAGQKVAAGVLATVAGGVTSQNPLSVNMETFSGIGPYLYGDYTGTSTLNKPNITGIDGVIVSGAGGFGNPQPDGSAMFCGTSATSPNVGALIADMMSADPGQPVSVYYTALENSASQTAITNVAFNGCFAPTSTGYTSAGSGSGLAQGFSALQSFFTFPSTSITAPIAVASGASGSYTVPTGVGIGFTASVNAGTNSASPANCAWVAGVSLPNGTTQTGAAVAYNFTAAGNYTVEANCPDSQGILSPTPPTIAVTAASIPAPTAAISAVTSSGFTLTLTGHEPLTVIAASSNTNVYPANSVQVSSGCGTTTLTCSIALTPQALGSSTITVTATDQYGQSGNANTQVTFTVPAPTVAISGASSTSFNLTLTGHEPLTVSATSSNTAIYPVSGIQISAGCGTNTLACSVSLSPTGQTSGSSTITVTATDQYGQTGNGAASVTYTYTPPSSGGGGGVAWIVLAFLGLAVAMRSSRRDSNAPSRFEE